MSNLPMGATAPSSRQEKIGKGENVTRSKTREITGGVPGTVRTSLQGGSHNRR